MRPRPFYVAVFTGPRARDLVGVFAALAGSDGEAYQQAWDYVRDHWATDPARLEYYAVAARPTFLREVSGGQA